MKYTTAIVAILSITSVIAAASDSRDLGAHELLEPEKDQKETDGYLDWKRIIDCKSGTFETCGGWVGKSGLRSYSLPEGYQRCSMSKSILSERGIREWNVLSFGNTSFSSYVYSRGSLRVGGGGANIKLRMRYSAMPDTATAEDRARRGCDLPLDDFCYDLQRVAPKINTPSDCEHLLGGTELQNVLVPGTFLEKIKSDLHPSVLAGEITATRVPIHFDSVVQVKTRLAVGEGTHRIIVLSDEGIEYTGVFTGPLSQNEFEFSRFEFLAEQFYVVHMQRVSGLWQVISATGRMRPRTEDKVYQAEVDSQKVMLWFDIFRKP